LSSEFFPQTFDATDDNKLTQNHGGGAEEQGSNLRGAIYRPSDTSTSFHDEGAAGEGKIMMIGNFLDQIVSDYTSSNPTPKHDIEHGHEPETKQHDLNKSSVPPSKPDIEYGANPEQQKKQVDLNTFSAMEDMPIDWIHYFVAFAVSLQSIVNGFILGTVSLLLYEEFGLSKSLVGVCFAFSAVSGVVASYAALNKTFVLAMKRCFPSPYYYYFI
jgi:hypothetical protein